MPPEVRQRTAGGKIDEAKSRRQSNPARSTANTNHVLQIRYELQRQDAELVGIVRLNE